MIKGKERGWDQQAPPHGPDLLSELETLSGSQLLSHSRLPILEEGDSGAITFHCFFCSEEEKQEPRGLKCQVGTSLWTKILSLIPLDTRSGH